MSNDEVHRRILNVDSSYLRNMISLYRVNSLSAFFLSLSLVYLFLILLQVALTVEGGDLVTKF